MILKREPFYGNKPQRNVSPPSGDRELISFKGSKSIRQTHEIEFKEIIQILTEIIPEQYRMKVEGSPNPVEKAFITTNRLDIIYSTDANTNILFEFDFDGKSLDKIERKKLSSKLIAYFNESQLPVVVHSSDHRWSKHIVCIDSRKKFDKLRAKYLLSLEVKPTGTVQKAIPFLRQ